MAVTFSRQHTVNGIPNAFWKSPMTSIGCWRSSRSRTAGCMTQRGVANRMREGHASRTAEQNALFRALESARPGTTRVCDDVLARHFLTWPLTLVMRLAALPGGVRFVSSFIDRRWPGVRSSVVARTRLIDDVLGAALEEK